MTSEQKGIVDGVANAPSLFLSYAHANKDMAFRFKSDLQAQGMHVWVDNEAILAGTPDWEEAVREAIRDADAFLLLASPAAQQSPYVKDEIRIAQQLYKRTVYAVWVEGEDWMACIPMGLGGTQYIDARRSSYPTALSALVEIFTTPNRVGFALLEADGAEEPRNPYKGLDAFTEADAQDFFGRTALTHLLAANLRHMLSAHTQEIQRGHMLAVVGPSGSGKSSVVMAGLLPCLRRGEVLDSREWIYLEPITPGEDPLENVAATLTRQLPDANVAVLKEDLWQENARGLCLYIHMLLQLRQTNVVLVIDQFEELFTLTTTEYERRQFINLLTTALTEPQSPLIVLLVLRADFYDRPMQYPAFEPLLSAHQQTVLPMTLTELRAAIEAPAEKVGLTFEKDLVNDVLFEMVGQSNALPLLQFTLEQLFQHRNGRQLTSQAYKDLGGIGGALRNQAEKTYTTFPSQEQRHLARSVFLRLMSPGMTEQETTRRRAAHSEFERADPVQTQQMQEILEAFIQARLLTTNQMNETTTIEVSHEALIREWRRLAEWLREARGDILFQQSLSEDVAEWEIRKQPRDRLYRGVQLKEAQAWARRNRPSKQEAAFLHASMRQRTFSLVSLIVLACVLLSSLGGAGWFFAKLPPDPTLVTTLQDNVNGSLRYCVESAPTGSTIRFAQGLHGTISLKESLSFPSAEHLTIHGPGAGQLTISGARNSYANVIVPPGATLTLAGLSFKNSQTIIYAFIENEGALTVTQSIISNNSESAGSTSYGGGIYNAPGATMTVSNSTFSGNSSRSQLDGEGGAITNEGRLTVAKSVFSQNTVVSSSGTSFGGGIDNAPGATMTVSDSTFSGNSSSGKQISQGGGIDNEGKLTVVESIFSQNTVVSSNGKSFGGGIDNYETGTVTVGNSTFSGNSSSGKQISQGGGIDNQGKLMVVEGIFSQNMAVSSNGYSLGGGICNEPGTSLVRISGSIIAANTAAHSPDISGVLISDGYNLLTNVAGATGLNVKTDRQVTMANLKLDTTLRNNGGPTQTLALLPGSPAIDAVPLQACHITVTDPVSGQKTIMTMDQRGDPRPDGSEQFCDIGAYEYQD